MRILTCFLLVGFSLTSEERLGDYTQRFFTAVVKYGMSWDVEGRSGPRKGGGGVGLLKDKSDGKVEVFYV